MDNAIVQCCCTYPNLRNHRGCLGIPARLNAGGRYLVERTVAKLRACGPDVTVLVLSEQEMPDGLPVVRPDVHPTPCWVDRYWCCEKYLSLDGTTHVLFGDVWFSPQAFRMILSPLVGPLRWYGRPGPSKCTGKTKGELFGFSATAAGQTLLKRCTEEARAAWFNGYRSIDLQFHVHQLTGVPLTVIDDLTEDFDSGVDHKRWQFNFDRAYRAGFRDD